jgi:acyl-CoA synthetase (AMP-forming)/AMP-acid ligase II
MTRLAELATAGSATGHPLALLPDGILPVERIAGLDTSLGPDDVVLVSIGTVRPLVETLCALDGRVAGMLLVSASLDPETVGSLARIGKATCIVSDRADLPDAIPSAKVLGEGQGAEVETTWMMTTSGTTGVPKIVPHTLASLSRTVRRDPLARRPIWGLLYDMTRFAGLQVALQSLIGGGTLAAADTREPLARQVAFLAEAGTTHLSATPTLWRRLLMVPGIERLGLRQATLGGEIADQAILDAVSARFPKARVTHIYASTEAGVGFAVNDRRTGFPPSYLDDPPGGVGVRVAEGMLWLRPPGGRRPAYLGGQEIRIDADGYVLTGDRIEMAEDRALFLGRDSGVVNVGGVKIHPERVERTIAAVEGVGLVQVGARKSPITGALLVATVVPATPDTDRDALKTAIMAWCREELEREAIPARIKFVDSLETNAAGKIRRS